ncbi:MAG: hypothetical protein M4D80_42205, partial [Myxococcota bacterium]|nr:hypothetical protein [Myxococcota bacterium]
LELLSGDFAEVPQTDGPLSVGDETLMVRPVTVVTGHGKYIAIAVLALAAIVGAFFIIRSQGNDDDDPRYKANPNIKLPPPSNPMVVQPVIPPDVAEEETEEVEVEEDVVDAGSGSDEPGTLLEPPAKKKKKIRKTVRRPPRDTQKPAEEPTEPTEPADGTWDPNGLFPKK